MATYYNPMLLILRQNLGSGSHGERWVFSGSLHGAAAWNIDLRGHPGEAPWTHVLLPQAPQVLDNLPEVVSKLNPNKGIQYWVQTAVQVCNSLRDGLSNLDRVYPTTGLLREQGDGVEEQGDVVGQVASNEYHYYSQNHTHSLVPLKVFGVKQRNNDAGIAKHHDGQRQEETHCHLSTRNQNLHHPCCLVVCEAELAYKLCFVLRMAFLSLLIK